MFDFEQLLEQVAVPAPEDGLADHGQWFDDGRRWCALCESPRWPNAACDTRRWQHMICHTCSAVWPEHQADFLLEVMDNDVITMDRTTVH